MAKLVLKGGRRVPAKPVTEKRKAKDHEASSPAKFKLDGLSLKALYRATPPFIKNNSHEVVIKSLQQVETRGGFPAIKAKALSVGGNGKRHVYATNVIGKEKDIALGKQKHVLVSCQCDYFLYYCEVALNHWGSAKIQYSNGEHPGVTNPQLHPMLCKHLVKLTDTIIEHGF